MKAVASSRSSRNRDMSPMDSTPTVGQKSSSKKKKTLRVPIMKLRTTKAQTATASARQLNEDLLQLRLVHLQIADLHALSVQGPQQLGHPLLGVVHGALRPAVARLTAEHARGLGQPAHRRRVELQGDDVADPDLTLQLIGGAPGQDEPGLDERDLVAELLGLPHVVGGEDDGDPPLPAQRNDVPAHAGREV